MKYLLCLVATLSLSAFASEVEVIKTPVYDKVKCLEMSHVGRRDVSVTVDSVKDEDTYKEITLNVQFYNCMEVPGGYGFREASAEDAQSFLFRDGKIVTANKSLNYARFFRIIGDDVKTHDVVKNDNKYQVVVDVENETSEFALGLALNFNITVNGEIVHENEFEYGSPTYLKINE